MQKKFIETESIYNASDKIWSGVKSKPIYGSDSSIGQIALQSLMKYPEHIAQICYPNGKQYTNREIATLSIRVAQHFKQFKLEQCDVIGICAANSDFIAPLFFGAMLSGLTVSTLDPSFDKDGIKHTFSITKPKLMFCDGAIYKTIKEAFNEIKLNANIFTVKDHIKEVPEITEFIKETGMETAFKPESLKFGSSQTAAILCSSGTTGFPKGVCMSHTSLLHTHSFNIDHEVKLLCFSTLYWVTGILCLIGGTIGNATRIISVEGFNTEDFFKIIEKYKINTLLTPPSQIAMSVLSPNLKDANLSSVRNHISAGSAVPYSLVQKIKPYMPNAQIYSGYGMSEISGIIAVGTVAENGSTGKLIKNIEVKIVDDKGNSLGPRVHGEIYLRSIFPWAGYYGDIATTVGTYDKQRWIHSGDIGYVDNDGHLFVVDRKKDILKYNNFHFFPTEIENIINEIPGVAEVCVCGIPDEVSTHLPAAAIVKTASSTLTEDDVCKYVANNTIHYKHLRGGAYFLDDIPKTASGKNLRRVVAEMCEKLKNGECNFKGKGKIGLI